MTTFDESYLESTLRLAFESPTEFKVPKGVVRYDYGSTHGWWVRVTRDRATFKQMFYDGQTGSIENGLRLALLYRHEILEAFPVTITTSFKRGLSQNPEERVHLITEPGKLNPYTFWRATWHDSEYKRKTKNFSVLKYGLEKAREFALEAARLNHNPIQKQYNTPDLYIDEKWRTFRRADIEVAAADNDYSYRKGGTGEPPADTSPFGYEGERRARLHMSIERDKTLRNKKIHAFLRQYGRLHCELCSMNFVEQYPFLSRDIIEVHHLQPLSNLSSTTRIELSDLVLLCSNCHMAIHQGDAVVNMSKAKLHFSQASATRGN